MRKLCGLLALYCLCGLQALSQNVQYSYDPLGRLTGVIDQNGNAARYSYDVNGNIVSITRLSSSQVGIFSFSPVSGPPGTVVKITGYNLSSGTSAPSVSFNGASATPDAYSPTSLTVQVPAAATSGTISVSNAIGTATSPQVFTVTDPNSGPVITALSPTINDSTTAETVTGLNFSPTAAANHLSLNGISLPVQTSSATSLTFAIPSQLGSGHLLLVNPLGRTRSAADLYVAPYGYTSSHVQVAQRLSPGASFTTGTIDNSSVGMLLFDGTEGRRGSVLVQNVTFPGWWCYTYGLSIKNPDGSWLGGSTPECGQANGFIDSFPITQAGSYALVVTPYSGTGSVNATAFIFDDYVTTATVGTPAPLIVTTPGQNALATFSGVAGQVMNAWLADVAISGCYSANFRLIKPDGTNLAATDLCYQNSAGFSSVTLPTSGTYTAVMDPDGPLTGTANLVLSSDVTGTLTPGTATQFTTTLVGQKARFTVSATAGRRGSVLMTSAVLSGVCNGTITVLNPDGSQLASVNPCGFGGTLFLDAFTFPSTGTYTVVVSDQNGGPISGNLTVFEFDDITGTAAANSSTNISTSSPGQNAVLTFSGTAGQQINVGLSNVTYPGCWSTHFAVLNPDGSQLAATNLCIQPSAALSGLTLPVSGVYQIIVDPQNFGTGGATVSLSSDLFASVTPGNPTSFSLTAAGQAAHFTFGATAGQRGSALLTGSSFPGCWSVSLTFLNPDGSVLSSTNLCGTGTAFLDAVTFPSTGTYTALVQPTNGGTGGATLTVYEFADVTSTVALGSPSTVTTSAPGQNAAVTFAGSANQVVNLWTVNSSIPGCWSMYLGVLNPDGSQLANESLCGQAPAGFSNLVLPASGTYTVSLDPQWANTGAVTVVLSTDLTDTITPGTDYSLSIPTPGQNARLSFSAAAGQQATVGIQNTTFSGCWSTGLSLVGPDGSTLSSSQLCGGGSLSLPTVTLGSAGTYTVVIKPLTGSTGTTTVQVNLQ